MQPLLQRKYNYFYKGISQDNFLTGGPNFIYTRNLDGLKDGYGIQLYNKPKKQIFTNGPIRAIFHRGLDETAVSPYSILVGDGGEIYKYDSADNTPVYTVTEGDLLDVIYFRGDYSIFINTTFNNIKTFTINLSDVFSDNFSAGVISTSNLFNSSDNPPFVQVGNFAFVGGDSAVYRLSINAGDTIIDDTYTFPDRQIVGITLQGTTLAVYTETGKVFMWDGVSLSESARGDFGGRIQKVFHHNGNDFIYMEDGQVQVASFVQNQNLTRPNKSKRLDDNSNFFTKYNFNFDGDYKNNLMASGFNHLYMVSNDTEKSIYKYGSLINGLAPGFHNIITENHEGTQIDEIYDIKFLDKAKRLYFSYKAGVKYGVDYIHFESEDIVNNGYAITEIFSGETTQTKVLQELNVTTSNITGNSYIKVYYRVNNGAWELIKELKNQDTIQKNDIFKANGQAFKEFIDIQFKIEFYGETKSPILHEFNYIYYARD